MANELQYYGDPSDDSGLTIVARVYDNAGAQVGSDVSCTEVGALAIYQGDMPTAAAGSYGVRFFDGITLVAQGCIDWDGAAEITEQTLNTALSTKASQTSVDAIDTDDLPTLAQMEASSALTAVADISSVATSAEISALNNITAADVYAEFTTGSNEDAFKADVSAVATQASVDLIPTNPLLATSYTAPDNASIAAILADTNELQTNQGDWATATGFSTHSAADVYTEFTAGNNEDAFKADVSALATQTSVSAIPTNPLLTDDARLDNLDATISSRLASSGYVAPDNTSIAAILTDTNDLQTNKNTLGNVGIQPTIDAIFTQVNTAIPNSISSLNDFDPATDVVANVTLVDTVTTNTDMRGTDNASLVDPDNTSIASILADTNELQTNQSDWLTATGFATPANVSAAQAAIQTDIGNLNDISSADVTAAVPTTAQIEAALLNEGDGQQLIDAIVQAIGNENIDQALLVAAIRSDLERVGGLLDGLPTLSEVEASTILAKTSDITGLNDIEASDVWAVASRTVTGGTIDTNNDMRGTDNALLVSSYSAPDNISVASIKAKTDQLTFSETNVVDANIQYVNDVEVQGTGTSGDEWGPV